MAIVFKIVKNSAGDEDLSLEDGKIEMSENGEAAAVQMKERILLGRNEAIANPLIDTNADPTAGLQYEDIVFNSSRSKSETELEFKRVIFSTPGISKITYWFCEQVGRELQLNFKVDSDWGELTFGETVQL